MTLGQVLEKLAADCVKAGNQSKWAATHRISGPYVSDVLAGRREPGQKVLAAMGLERVVTYRRVSKPAAQPDARKVVGEGEDG